MATTWEQRSSAFTRGGTVAGLDFDSLPKRYRDVLAEQGITSQREADSLTLEEATRVIRVVQEQVGEGNARRLPLGRGAYEQRDYRTEANRMAVSAFLFRFYAGEFDETAITLPLSRGEAKTGAELAPKLVTKADVAVALAHLSYARHDLYDLLVRRYRDNVKLHEIAQSAHRGRQTVGELHREALNLLVDYLWQDIA